jgi:hypothetical protein
MPGHSKTIVGALVLGIGAIAWLVVSFGPFGSAGLKVTNDGSVTEEQHITDSAVLDPPDGVAPRTTSTDAYAAIESHVPSGSSSVTMMFGLYTNFSQRADQQGDEGDLTFEDVPFWVAKVHGQCLVGPPVDLKNPPMCFTYFLVDDATGQEVGILEAADSP